MRAGHYLSLIHILFIIWIANVDKVQRKGVYNEKYKKTKLYFSYRNVCFNVNINIFSCSGTDNKPKTGPVSYTHLSSASLAQSSICSFESEHLIASA